MIRRPGGLRTVASTSVQPGEHRSREGAPDVTMIVYNDTDDYDDDKGAGQKMFGGFFSGKGGGGGRYWVPPDFLGIFLSLCPCG